MHYNFKDSLLSLTLNNNYIFVVLYNIIIQKWSEGVVLNFLPSQMCDPYFFSSFNIFYGWASKNDQK